MWGDAWRGLRGSTIRAGAAVEQGADADAAVFHGVYADVAAWHHVELDVGFEGRGCAVGFDGDEGWVVGAGAGQVEGAVERGAFAHREYEASDGVRRRWGLDREGAGRLGGHGADGRPFEDRGAGLPRAGCEVGLEGLAGHAEGWAAGEREVEACAVCAEEGYGAQGCGAEGGCEVAAAEGVEVLFGFG